MSECKILKETENEQACVKCNISGWTGTGKTYAAAHIALGLLQGYHPGTPLGFFDTENGSDFIKPLMKEHGIKVLTAKTRAFTDLVKGLREAEGTCKVVIVDSVTHYWRDLETSYREKKKIPFDRKLAFHHWGAIKGQSGWQQFLDLFLNNQIHMICCGRMGWEWKDVTDEDGNKELTSVGTKMKAEGEFGHEPSLALEIYRLHRGEITGEPKAKGFIHRMRVIKDRWDKMNGAEFDFDPDKRKPNTNPIFDALRPCIEMYNIGGKHFSVDTERDSQGMFSSSDTGGNYEAIQRAKTIVLEEIQGIIVAQFPGQSAPEKKAKADLIFDCFGTRSWTQVESFDRPRLIAGLQATVGKINEMRAAEGQEPIPIPAIAEVSHGDAATAESMNVH